MLSLKACFLLLLVNGATLNSNVSPVQKVIQLLDELKGKVSNDLASEEKMMEEYTSWCDEEANQKEDDITSSTRTIGDLNAEIEDTSASIGALTSEIEELGTKISTADADLAKAKQIRDGEHADFTKAEKELVDTIDTLERAIIVLKRGQTSFLQSPSKDIQALAAGLSEIVKASWINSKQRTAVESLLQSQQSSEDEDLSLQPQATTAAYTSQGGGILDVLADMLDKARASLSDTRKDEMTSSHEFQLLDQSLTDELAVMSKRMAAAKSQRSGDQEAKSTAEGTLSEETASKASDEKYLSDLKNSCAAKSSSWEQRQADASEEMAAIEKAKEILASGVKAFVQMSATSHNSEDGMKRSQVTKILAQVSRNAHSFSFGQLVSASRTENFDKVKGLIESMIDKLTKEAAEEADTKMFCDKETSESKEKQAQLSADFDRTATRIEKGEAGKAQLLAAIKNLEEEIAAIDKGQAEATEVRQKEHATYEKASKDYKDSADAVAQATAVLQNYYQGAFVQVSAKQPEFQSAKSDVASQILGMLEVAESDFTRLLAEAEADESTSQSTYDKMTQDNKVSRATKVTDAKAKRSEVKSLEMSLLNYNEDKDTTSKELDAVLLYLEKLRPQCETKVMTYAERVARREQEIDGLKEALTILEG